MLHLYNPLGMLYKECDMSKPVIDRKVWLKKFKWGLLCSLPTSLLISISVSADLSLKQHIGYNEYLYYFIVMTLVSLIFLSVPVTIALHENYRYKGWIIGFALCCFLPFGTLLYLVSLVWALALLFKRN